ncbi:MAG TPA: NAD(P)H-dependent oxidoreductase [Armatimonadota bacterium]|nr:NAD(P)H-dependent oxidoreductase [Armatimonadota bacterium]
MAKVLVVYHSLGGNTKKMAEAVAEGARAVAGTEVTVKTGLEAGIDDLLGCDAVALGSPDYFSYMAGGLKDFLDRTYYPSQDKVPGKPAAVFGSAGGPSENILKVLQQAVGWFKLKEVAKPVGSSGGASAGAIAACRELGRSLAEAAQERS